MGGIERNQAVFDEIIKRNLLEGVLYEMMTAVAIWENIVSLSDKIVCADQEVGNSIRVSARYGPLPYAIMEQGWRAAPKGYEGDRAGTYDGLPICLAIERHDELWEKYRAWKEGNPACATLYTDKHIEWDACDKHKILLVDGMGASVDRYRYLTK